MYRNIVYSNAKSMVKLFTWDNDGNRITKNFQYEPYLYLDTGNEADAVSIFGGNLKKRTFKNSYDRYKFVKDSKIVRIYNNLPVEQNFLIDAFCKHNKHEDFSKFPLSIFAVDIECPSPDEFPDEWEAKYPINVVTIYNSLKKEYRVFCLENDFNPDNLTGQNRDRYDKIKDEFDIVSTTHATEPDLLKAFLNYWKEDYPDVVTGWNLTFDIPYIVNRMMKLLAGDTYLELSPVDDVREVNRPKRMEAQFTQYVRDYTLGGITILDYFELYAKFNFKPVPNRKLDTIAEIELGIGKVKFDSSNLYQLAIDDWDTYVFYNIEDVNIIRLLEERLNFLKVARLLSYMGMTPLNKSMDTIPIINGYCAVNAYEDGKIIPTFNKEGVEWRTYDGAFVKEPLYKFCEQIVSYDLNSLYPMTMVTLNASPETKVGKIDREYGDKVDFIDTSGKLTTITRENLDKFIKKNNIAVSKSNILFRQDKQGIFPKIVDEVYNKRLEFKSKIKANNIKLEAGVSKIEEKKLKDENIIYDVFQMTYKILINSLYGSSGNKYACMSDLDIAESVTLTCQHVIKESSNFLNKICQNILKEDEVIDRVEYCDTDSNYLIIKDLCNKYNIKFIDETTGRVTQDVLKLCDGIENSLNKSIKRWGEVELNSKDCRFEFKMESIADKALFLCPKNYILHILNNEGFHVDKESKRWKYKGIRLVSSSMPTALKPLVKEILHDMVMNRNKKSCDDRYTKSFEAFSKMDHDDIAQIKSMNKYDEYAKKCIDWNTAPRMLAHYRGAYYYNKILKDLGITNLYPKIKNGDKVKYLYLHSTNKYNINVISYVDNYPKEFESIFQINKNLMFEKGVKDVVNQFYAAVEWHLSSPNKQTKIDIFEEFLDFT